ncbi:sec34-like family protein [Ophiostoma piceae UAMH 11346]|uniref:Conserved oligomeric Golgi complex subunit 3 n=1 Tax=Ophiostoma piceae (strain UAMH 11346) TaxID=1262450 RepID=S3CAR4_OPHP1|nr:sec34-like family protein [Ophiostoma piceae UAMH 11346]
MYEDAWYSFVPEPQRSGRSSQGPGHRRRESLLQQPNGSQAAETLDALLEEDDDTNEDEDMLHAREDGLRQLRRTRSFPSVTERTASTRPKFAAASIQAALSSASAAKSATQQLPPAQTPTGSIKGNDRRLVSKKRGPKRKKEVTLEALSIADLSQQSSTDALEWQKLLEVPVLLDGLDDDLLQASQQEFLTYRDQLEMTERHLGSLVEDTNGALRLLSSLADSFRTVEEQTTSFQSQCDDLVSEQRRLQVLADEVGTDLHYYGYLDTATRRLNAPSAGRLADGEELAEILTNLDACIHFMATHDHYRDADTYLARYQALLTKALHLLEVGFTARLDKVATELTKQITATKSDAAQHALAYGRFEELLVEKSYALVPNVQQVVASAYHPQTGAARTEKDQDASVEQKHSYAIYTNTANNIFQTYLQWRDQCLRPVIQKELDMFHADVKEAETSGSGSAEHKAAVETASRSFVKQSFERSYHEVLLFAKVFAVDPQYSADAEHSVFGTLRSYRSDLVNAVNVTPLATLLQTTLAGVSDLTVVCNVLGWITHEYLLREHEYDYDDDDESNDSQSQRNGGGGGVNDSYMMAHSRQLAARLLAEHLWVFADALFEAEVAKTISKVAVVPEALKIEAAAPSQSQLSAMSGAASNTATAYPPVRRAVELLVMFDQAMPKERCQRSSPVVFKIVKETILALQRAETRIKTGRLATDPDLFMIKNLLILKNELLSLEIGDIRDGPGAGSGAAHFGQIWEALSMAQHLVGYFTTFIPGAQAAGAPALTKTAASAAVAPAPTVSQSLWSRAASVAGGYTRAASVVGSMTGSLMPSTPGFGSSAPNASASSLDISEQLDDALRRSITAFTTRWGKTLYEGTSRKLGGKNVAKMERELDELLQTAFGGQPDVVAKLKEAIENQVRAAEQPEKRK